MKFVYLLSSEEVVQHVSRALSALAELLVGLNDRITGCRWYIGNWLELLYWVLNWPMHQIQRVFMHTARGNSPTGCVRLFVESAVT